MRPSIYFKLLLAGSLLLGGCRQAAPPEASVQTVRGGTVQRMQREAPERYAAVIAPSAQVDLAFPSPGILERVHQVRGADGRTRDVQAGDFVAKGTELAFVRATDYEHRVEQANAQVQGSQAQQAQARAQLAQAQANFEEAQVEYTRANNLYQSASLVKPQYDQAKGRYDTAAASVKAAQASVEGTQAAVENAQAALNQAKLTLSDTALRAPFAGWITARNVDNGSVVNAATAGFSMIDTHLVKAVFAVPDSSLRLIHLGDKQVVMLDTLQHPVRGVVTAIAPQADPRTRVFSVEVTIDNPRAEIKPGMIGSLSLGGAAAPASKLVAPLSAVVRAPSDPRAFAVYLIANRNGKSYAEARRIEIGQTIGNSIEVTSGLSEGQRIVAMGGSLLRDGQEVRVLP